MDVELTRLRQVVADNQADLLDVESTTPDVCSDENTALPRPELFHDRVSFLLGHTAVHEADREVSFTHLPRQPLHLGAFVAENYGLSDRQSVI